MKGKIWCGKRRAKGCKGRRRFERRGERGKRKMEKEEMEMMKKVGVEGGGWRKWERVCLSWGK